MGILRFELAEIEIRIDDVVGEAWGRVLSAEQDALLRARYELLVAMRDIWTDAIAEGLERMDWPRMHREGRLSLRDYELFRDKIVDAGVTDDEIAEVVRKWYPGRSWPPAEKAEA